MAVMTFLPSPRLYAGFCKTRRDGSEIQRPIGGLIKRLAENPD
jgi:hypothetical protein